MERRKKAIAILTVGSTLLVIIHMLDEGDFTLIGSGFVFQAGFIGYVCAWLAAPYLAALVGLIAKSNVKVRVSLLASTIYFGIFLLYVSLDILSRSDEPKMGAQHFHLILIPFFLLISAVALFLPLVFVSSAKPPPIIVNENQSEQD